MGAGGCVLTTEKEKTRALVAKERFAARHAEMLRNVEDYAGGPVNLPPNRGVDPWKLLADSQCRFCSRKPLATYCDRCNLEVCGLCADRLELAPFPWVCLDCKCGSNGPHDQARLLVACQNDEVPKRTTVITAPEAEIEDGLSAAIAQRSLADLQLGSEVAWWAEVKRKDWSLHDEKPAMPLAVMKGVVDKIKSGRDKRPAKANTSSSSAVSRKSWSEVKAEPEEEAEYEEVTLEPEPPVGGKGKEDEEALGQTKQGIEREDQRSGALRRTGLLKRSAEASGVHQEPVPKRRTTDEATVLRPDQKMVGPVKEEISEAACGEPEQVGTVTALPQEEGPVKPVVSLEQARGADGEESPEALIEKAMRHFAQFNCEKVRLSAGDNSLFVRIAIERNLRPLPLSAAVMAEVAAVLRAGEAPLGGKQLSLAKQLHVAESYDWSKEMEEVFEELQSWVSEPLQASWPEKVAEVPPPVWSKWRSKGCPGLAREPTHPDVGPELWGMGSAFFLTLEELARVLVGSIVIDPNQKQVTMKLPMSGTNPSACGGKRMRACTCQRNPSDTEAIDCPFHSVVETLTVRVKKLKDLGKSEDEIRKLPVVGQVSAPILVVTMDAMVDALCKDAAAALGSEERQRTEEPASTVLRCGGNTLRVSGVRDAVLRHGVSLAVAQWLVRWGASSLLRSAGLAQCEGSEEDEMQVKLWQQLVEKGLEKERKPRSFEELAAKVKEKLNVSEACARLMTRELLEGWRPQRVVNLALLVVHATAKMSSAEWLDDPCNWLTRCGRWRWAAAGQLARPLTAREQAGEAVAVCNWCRPLLEDEELVSS